MAQPVNIQEGLVAERIARLRAITVRNSNPSLWKQPMQPYEQPAPISSDPMDDRGSRSATRLSSQPSCRSIVQYVSNDEFTGTMLRPMRSVPTAANILSMVALDGPGSQSQPSKLNEVVSDITPLRIAKAGKASTELKTLAKHAKPPGIESSLEEASLGIDIMEPQPQRYSSTQEDKIAAQLEENVRRLSSADGSERSNNLRSLIPDDFDWKTTAANTDDTSQESLFKQVIPQANVALATDYGLSEVHHPRKFRTLKREMEDKGSITESTQSRAAFGRRLRSRFTSFAKSDKTPTIADRERSKDAFVESVRPENEVSESPKPRSPKQYRSLRLFNRSTKAEAPKSLETKATVDKREASEGDMHTVYSSSRLHVRQCDLNHENIEVKDERGACVVIFTVAGGGKMDPVRMEMNLPLKKGRYRRCEACKRQN